MKNVDGKHSILIVFFVVVNCFQKGRCIFVSYTNFLIHYFEH